MELNSKDKKQTKTQNRNETQSLLFFIKPTLSPIIFKQKYTNNICAIFVFSVSLWLALLTIMQMVELPSVCQSVMLDVGGSLSFTLSEGPGWKTLESWKWQEEHWWLLMAVHPGVFPTVLHYSLFSLAEVQAPEPPNLALPCLWDMLPRDLAQERLSRTAGPSRSCAPLFVPPQPTGSGHTSLWPGEHTSHLCHWPLLMRDICAHVPLPLRHFRCPNGKHFCFCMPQSSQLTAQHRAGTQR